MKRSFLALAAFLATGACAIAQTQTPVQTVNVRGVITAFDGNVLTVTTPTGTSKVTLNEGAQVRLVVKSSLAKIVPGAYVGTAAEPQADGMLRAQEVLLFPESLRGRGEGHRPWDLTPKSTMTNATVDEMTPRVVDRVEGRVLTLKYKDGEKQVFVPANVPIVTFEPGDKSMLVSGAHVVIIGATKRDDGSHAAAAVNVGKGDLVPPM
jgi:hypothetical protein